MLCTLADRTVLGLEVHVSTARGPVQPQHPLMCNVTSTSTRQQAFINMKVACTSYSVHTTLQHASMMHTTPCTHCTTCPLDMA